MASLNNEIFNQEYLNQLMELAKFEIVMNLLEGMGMDWGEPDHGLTLRDILKILVRNGCPVDALLSTLKEIGEKLTKEGDDDE